MTTFLLSLGSLGQAIRFDDAASEEAFKLVSLADPNDHDTQTPIDDGQILQVAGGSGQLTPISLAGAGVVTGTGTTGKLSKWSSSTGLTDSVVTESGGNIDVAGDVSIADDNGLIVGHASKVNFGAIPELQVLGTGAADASMGFGRWGASVGGATLRFLKSRHATIGSNTIVQDGDELGRIRFQAADGSDFNTNAAEISAEVDGAPGLNDMPGRILFSTTSDGASSVTERMRIDSAGNVIIAMGDLDLTSGNLDVGGGLSMATVAKTGAYTATAADYTILCDASGGAFTVTLPAAASHPGRIYNIKKTDSSANAVTIDGASSETIDGMTTVVISSQHDSVQLQGDGTEWWIL